MDRKRYAEQLDQLGFDSDPAAKAMQERVREAAAKPRRRRYWLSAPITAGVLLTVFLSILSAGGRPPVPIAASSPTHAPESGAASRTADASGGKASSPTHTPESGDMNGGEAYVFNPIRSVREGANRPIPPEGSYKQELSFAEYKKRLGCDPVPAYLPAGLSAGYGHKDTDKQEVTFLSDGSLAEKALGSWSCQFDDPRSGASVRIEISRGGINKDYVLTGPLQISSVPEGAVLCSIDNGGVPIFTAEFPFHGYVVFLYSRGVKQEEFIKMLASYPT